MASITTRPFGTLPDGHAVTLATLTGPTGLSCDIADCGATLVALRVPAADGGSVDVVLGFPDLAGYLAPHPYIGVTVGRVAGRIAGARMRVDDRDHELAANEPPHHLHGGRVAFDKRLWKAMPTAGDEPSLRLELFSPDGEEGYPGNVHVAVTYTVTRDHALRIRYEATTDMATPLALTNHAYFNLAGEGRGTILDHTLEVRADETAAVDASMAPVGRRAPVTPANDFNRPRLLADAVPGLFRQHGDDYFIRRAEPRELVTAVVFAHPPSGLSMTVRTTEDTVQVYTGKVLDGSLRGKSGAAYPTHAGLCLECQGCSGAVQFPALGDIVLRPGRRYEQTTEYGFHRD